MALNNLEDRLECAIRHINTALDIDTWAQNLAVESMRMRIAMLKTGQSDIIRCKDCKHFEYDHLYVIHGVPVLGHELCNAWGDGCKTDENGYCFLAERRTDEGDRC